MTWLCIVLCGLYLHACSFVLYLSLDSLFVWFKAIEVNHHSFALIMDVLYSISKVFNHGWYSFHLPLVTCGNETHI